MGCAASKHSKQISLGSQPNKSSERKVANSQQNFNTVTSSSVPEVITLTFEEASKLQPKDPNEMWTIVKGTSDKEGIQIEPTKNRKGWKTIRIFVSSTFKDFHQEREVLVKEVIILSLGNL